jgi:DNA-binding transcriptional LysR family regulator
MMLPVMISVTGTESYFATAFDGDGRRQQVLPDFPPSPMPISLLYPRNRQLSPRVRAFVDWAAQAIAGRA